MLLIKCFEILRIIISKEEKKTVLQTLNLPQWLYSVLPVRSLCDCCTGSRWRQGCSSWSGRNRRSCVASAPPEVEFRLLVLGDGRRCQDPGPLPLWCMAAPRSVASTPSLPEGSFVTGHTDPESQGSAAPGAVLKDRQRSMYQDPSSLFPCWDSGDM